MRPLNDAGLYVEFMNDVMQLICMEDRFFRIANDGVVNKT